MLWNYHMQCNFMPPSRYILLLRYLDCIANIAYHLWNFIVWGPRAGTFFISKIFKNRSKVRFLAQTDVIIMFFGSKQPRLVPEYLNLDARRPILSFFFIFPSIHPSKGWGGWGLKYGSQDSKIMIRNRVDGNI